MIDVDELQRISRVDVADNPIFHESDTDGDAKLNEGELRSYQIAMARKRAQEKQLEQAKQKFKPTQDSEGV